MSPTPEWVILIVGAAVIARWGVVRAVFIGGLIAWWTTRSYELSLKAAAMDPGPVFLLAYEDTVEWLAGHPGLLKLLALVGAGWTLILVALGGIALLAQVGRGHSGD